MQNTSHKKTRLYESQDGIKIAERNINNFRYEDDNTLMAESEGLKCLLMKVKEEHEKAGLKLSIQKIKIVALAPSFQVKEMRGKWKQWQILYSWVPKSVQSVTAAMKLKDACFLK